jgi:hypothetical protein
LVVEGLQTVEHDGLKVKEPCFRELLLDDDRLESVSYFSGVTSKLIYEISHGAGVAHIDQLIVSLSVRLLFLEQCITLVGVIVWDATSSASFCANNSKVWGVVQCSMYSQSEQPHGQHACGHCIRTAANLIFPGSVKKMRQLRLANYRFLT